MNDRTGPFLAEVVKVFSDHHVLFPFLFEKATTGIVIFGPDFRILEANPFFCRLLGYSAEELQQGHCQDFIVPEDCRLQKEKIQALEKSESATLTLRIRFLTREGAPLPLQLHLVPVRDAARVRTCPCGGSTVAPDPAGVVQRQNISFPS